MSMNTGLSEKNRKAVAEHLCRFLADSYSLYLKTHYYHWNVTGPQFQQLHLLFEEHYTELAAAVDEIAERIRALGFAAPGTYGEFAKLGSIPEDKNVPDAQTMLRNLVEAHETVIRSAREGIKAAADVDDEVTAGLLTDRMTIHEKTAWMLRSHLEGEGSKATLGKAA